MRLNLLTLFYLVRIFFKHTINTCIFTYKIILSCEKSNEPIGGETVSIVHRKIFNVRQYSFSFCTFETFFYILFGTAVFFFGLVYLSNGFAVFLVPQKYCLCCRVIASYDLFGEYYGTSEEQRVNGLTRSGIRVHRTGNDRFVCGPNVIE